MKKFTYILSILMVASLRLHATNHVEFKEEDQKKTASIQETNLNELNEEEQKETLFVQMPNLEEYSKKSAKTIVSSAKNIHCETFFSDDKKLDAPLFPDEIVERFFPSFSRKKTEGKYVLDFALKEEPLLNITALVCKKWYDLSNKYTFSYKFRYNSPSVKIEAEDLIMTKFINLIHLDISDLDLKSPVEQIKNLKYMEALRENFRKLSSLASLKLEIYSILTEEDISLAANLTKLNLDNNQNIKNLKNFSKLTDLSICFSNIMNTGISHLTNLTILDISMFNCVTFNTLSLFSKLKVLSLYYNEKIESLPSSMHSTLTALDLSYNSKISEENLSHFTNLKLLNLTVNKTITANILPALPNLKLLFIYGSKIKKEDAQAFPNLEVKEEFLSNNKASFSETVYQYFPNL